jgi:hypothetical protein
MSFLSRHPQYLRIIQVTQAEINSPTADQLADYATLYQLNVRPYTRYISNGTILVLAGEGGTAGVDTITAQAMIDASITAIPSSATGVILKGRSNHTGNDPASNVTFSDNKTLEQWRALIEAQISGAASAPIITTAPAVPTGTLTVGSTLTFGALGSVTNGSGGAHSDLRQWNRVNLTSGASTPIPGYLMATSTPTTYVLTAADLGFYISGSQQARDTVNGLLSNVMTSVVTAIITGTAPTNSVAPALSPSGTQAANVVITCSTGTWANASTYGYLFYDNGVPIGTRSSVATLTLTSAMAGHSITADVLATSSLGVPSVSATSASNTITVAGTNTVINTVLPTITRANGEGAGIIFSGFTYPIVVADWTLNGSATTPGARQWDFYKNGVYYGTSTVQTFNVDVNFAVSNTFKLVETVSISGQSYSSSLASATTYTVNAAPATLTIQVNTASSTFQSGATITPYIPVTATGGTLPYTYSVNPSLPGSLSLNTSTGNISGVANTVSSASYTITVTDSVAAQVSGSTTVIIQGAAISEMAVLSAANTFASMNGYVQMLGGSTSLSSVSETTGITGSGTITLPSVGASTMRFGKINDPLDAARKVFVCAAKTGDGSTFNHVGRVEIGPTESTIQLAKTGTTYWFALENYVSTARWALGAGILFQLHQSDSATIPTGPFTLRIDDGVFPNKGVMIDLYQNSSEFYPWTSNNPGFSGNSVTLNQSMTYGTFALDVWHKWVFKYKGSNGTGGTGLLQAWLDGTQILNLPAVSIGVATPPTAPYDYMKCGHDGVESAGGSYVLVRSVHVIQDNGSYTEPQIRALLT